MKRDYDENENKFLLRVGVLFVVGMFVIWIAVCSVIGCGGLSAKQEEDLQNILKATTQTSKEVKGNNNKLTDIHTTTQKTKTEITKTQDQIQKGQGVTAKEIGELKTNINNVKNSSWLMFGYALVLSIPSVLLLGILLFVIRKLFSLKAQVHRAIASPHNDLDESKWNSL